MSDLNDMDNMLLFEEFFSEEGRAADDRIRNWATSICGEKSM